MRTLILISLLIAHAQSHAQTCIVGPHIVRTQPSRVVTTTQATTTYQPVYVYQPRAVLSSETAYPGDVQAIARNAALYRQLAEQLAQIYGLNTPQGGPVQPAISAIESEVLSVLERNRCTVCHGAERKGSLQLVDSGRITSEYDAAAVFDACFTGTMPKGGPQMSQADLRVLYNYGKSESHSQKKQPNDQPVEPAPVTPIGRRPLLDLPVRR